MDLHQGTYYWQHTLPSTPQYPSLASPLECDILIVGGGMSGAICAYLLTLQGIKPAILEKGSVGGGSSMVNTGLIQYSSDKTLTSMIHTFGESSAVEVYRASIEAVARLREISASLKPHLEQEPDFIPRSSLYFASTAEDLQMLREEFMTLQRHGFPAEWLSQTDIASKFPFTKPGAIYTSGDAELNPFRFTHALLQESVKRGARVYEHTPVTGMRFMDDGVLCQSGQLGIRARKVIMATGYETQQFKKDRGVYLTQSYAIATEPVKFLESWHERCLIWETRRPYLYLRTTPDNRVLVGGFDEPLRGNGLSPQRHLHQSKKLLQELNELFPGAGQVQADYAWGAVFGQTHDGLPLFGAHPKFSHVFFIEGYGGSGVVYSMIAAERITQDILGYPHPHLELFSLQRSSKPSP
ncbi:amino acid oxidase [Paenibacillus sp. CAA11]|uniref:NAD(P)/FAD-dependent oxidoreductase n=1 Tax=Paenibacillus sp. CAA11 TaxID=1532905 RepID=UPI000D3951CD|nr:FAD-dependent oxidoreductase [Paenibacillus sp. CAA11]AWB43949.1 amino acid oxidase [Paenibacillus sp. CAA11]